MKATREESDAYMAGWGHRQRGGDKDGNPYLGGTLTDGLGEFWRKGWEDNNRGAIDGPIALGPDYIEPIRYPPHK